MLVHRRLGRPAASRRPRRCLVVGRAVQGLGGAAVSAVALALIMGLFTDPGERAKAMGVFGFVMSGGGAVGVLLGGVLTGLLSWHWIFLVNVPIGVAVLARRPPRCCPPTTVGARRGQARRARRRAGHRRADARGVRRRRRQRGRLDLRPAPSACSASRAVLFVAFVVREARAANPLVPLRLFTLRNVVGLAGRRRALGRPRCSPGSSWPRSTSRSVLGLRAPSRSAWPSSRPAW